MIEDYGTLSEEELIEEIVRQLEQSGQIDASDLEFKFEEDKLIISGSLQTEEELELLSKILEDDLDPKDYKIDIEVIEGISEDFAERSHFEEEEEEEETDDLLEEGLEEVEEEDMNFEEEDEEDDVEEEEDKGGDFGENDKW